MAHEGKSESAGEVSDVPTARAGDGAARSAETDKATKPQYRPPLRRVGKRRLAGPSRSGAAANDDAPSIGGLIYALNQRPSKRPFMVAGIASALWLGLGGVLSGAMLTDLYSDVTSFGELLTRPALITITATVFVPIALFWFLAVLVWRAQELRLMSSAMTEVAVRLAEPDRLAEQSVASLGQTVRRQVTAMNDAIGRALGRAGELEALVHNEVAALERSYSENELRIRSLIDELASERDALTSNSERVSEVLRGIGNQVTHEITVAGDRASRSLTDVSASLAQELQQAGQNLTSTLEESSNRAAHLVSDRGNTLLSSLTTINEKIGNEVPGLLEKLGNEQTRLTQIVEGAGRNLAALETALGERTRELDSTLENSAESLGGTLDKRTAHLQSVLHDYTHTLDETITGKARALDAAIGEKMSYFDDSLSEKAQNFQATIQATGSRIEETIQGRSEEVEKRLVSHTREFEERVGAQSRDAAERIAAQAEHVEERIAGHAKRIEQTVVERTRAIDDAFAGRLKNFEESIASGASIIDEAIGDKAEALRNALREHANAVSRSLQQQSSELDQSLVEGIEAVRQTSQDISSRSIRTIEGLANQSSVLKEVSEGLLMQIKDLTERFEHQGQAISRAAQTLESSNFRIDSTLESRHGELSTLLETISERAQQFDGVMRAYSESIDRSLNQVENRAKQVTEHVAAGTEQTSQAALEELRQLSSRAQTEAERTLTDLRSRFTDVSKQVSDQLSDLSTKVSSTTEHMRDTTTRAAGELESAQSQFRERASQLPEQARQSTDAMRQALQDQIRAIDTLTEYTGRQAAAKDVTRSRPASADNNAMRDQARQGGETRSASPSAKYGSERAAGSAPASGPWPERRAEEHAPRRAEPQAAEPPAYDLRNVTDSLSQQMSAQPSGQFQDREEGDGWSLGDLLARASRAEDEGLAPSPSGASGMAAHAPESGGDARAPLDIEGIAAAIDQQTAANVWQRLRSGDSSMLDRNLYSQSGRLAFDEISERYNREPGFRTTVNRYLLDFETLLKEADRRDSGGVLINNYLSSETGRVYLFLAHAAGRLG